MLDARPEAVTLTIGGQRHDGWKSIRITRAIDSMCGEFQLGLADRWPDQPSRFALEADAACSVQVAGQTVLTGHIDQLLPTVDGEAHEIVIVGRDRAADLVDCSAVNVPGSWKNIGIAEIAAELAKPFGISVVARATTGPALRKFALQQGETVQAALERLCRFAGLLAVSTSAGGVELIAPAASAPVAAIVDGVNMLSGSATHDVSQRFSTYIVKGQASGDDHANGKTAAHPMAQAGDPAVKRYRPLIVIAEEQSTIANSAVRARWEASTRAGRGQSALIVVPGWRDDRGDLFAAGATVSVTVPRLFIDGLMLIQSVTFVLDERGTVAELVVTPPSAWSQLAIPEQAEASRVRRHRK
ncbi:phage baseplate assembly protein [Sphingomonas paucimobilis]|uniref:Mu P family protein n=1 Tax=Sphingomonas paucimobilis TaxID=13689 RepID=A0A7T3E4Y7_SPHPI|nr:contractile injection system protein, VgrG/Pvc8 family [Sphingomonas paucimobilis]QPT08578.1 hypothetical protein I6G38_17975 [Sphingomonas paucimobilis]